MSLKRRKWLKCWRTLLCLPLGIYAVCSLPMGNPSHFMLQYEPNTFFVTLPVIFLPVHQRYWDNTDCHCSNPLVGYTLQPSRFPKNMQQPELPYCHLDHQLRLERNGKRWCNMLNIDEMSYHRSCWRWILPMPPNTQKHYDWPDYGNRSSTSVTNFVRLSGFVFHLLVPSSFGKHC